jgi:hypothetical protein
MLRTDLRPVRIGISKNVFDEVAGLPQIYNAGGTSRTANAFQVKIKLLKLAMTGSF